VGPSTIAMAAVDMAKRAWKRNPRYRGLRPWKKGQSGNLKGRPPGSRNKVSGDKLVAIMQSKRTPAAEQVKAAKIILDLALGPPDLSTWDDD
jgi:hypothetical protein